MWEKAMYFGDEKSAVDIQVATNPAVAKKLGRKVRGYDDKLWSLRREYFMFQVNMMKYTQNPLLADELLATQNKVLVEASPYDTIWGIGLHYEDNLVLDEANWRGNNLLGKTLMKVRDRLREIKEVKSIYKKQRS